jgi:hypothetical protein
MSANDPNSNEYRDKYNINPNFVAENHFDENDNPTGGSVRSQGIIIDWQDGPRGQGDGKPLADPNGAFVEDIIYAAKQRLEFFQRSKFEHQANADAIEHLQAALDALVSRSSERKESGKLGTHKV